MSKFLIRKDVLEDMLEKGYGKRDLSKLTTKIITDKNGHRRKVYVRNGEQPAEVKQPKAQEGLSDEKRAKYTEMLEKVKNGPDENALFVSGEFLNKKDAIDYLEKKLGRKNGVVEDLNRRKSGKNIGQKMANAEDKAFEQSEKDAQKKYGNMTIEELKAEAKKYDGISNYSPEAIEARKVYDILNQKLEEEKKNKADKDINKISFEDSVKEYNFTDTKKTQFAMNEVANFYPELKDVVENHRKAFNEVSDAEKKLKINPNNKEYKDNFASAYNKLKQADEEYDKASKKAFENAPDIPKPDFSKYMAAKRDVQKFIDKYKQQSEEYDIGDRLRENGGESFLSPMYGLKPDDYSKDPDYIKAQMTIRAYEEK